jgi:organic radical activating enzyme
MVETSGAYELTGKWNWICISPKKQSPPLQQNLDRADELKVIIQNEEDIKWAEENAEKVPKKCRLFLQPEWSNRDHIMGFLTEYIMKNTKWTISLQAHKYMKIP